MTIEQLRKAVNDRPFRPFTIVLGDGTRYRVTSPEMIAMAPKAERTFIVSYGDEQYSVVDLLLVTALEFGGGRSRRSA
jgi:hypothetical protein